MDDNTTNNQQLTNPLKTDENPQEKINQALSAAGDSPQPKTDQHLGETNEPKPAEILKKPLADSTPSEPELDKPKETEIIETPQPEDQSSAPELKPEANTEAPTSPPDPLDAKADIPATPPPPPPMPGETPVQMPKPEEKTPPPVADAGNSGGGKPPEITPEEPEMSGPKRDFDRAKVAKIGGALLGLFLLVGGLIGANYLVQQQADQRSQAYSVQECHDMGKCESGGACHSVDSGHACNGTTRYTCQSDLTWGNPETNHPDCVGSNPEEPPEESSSITETCGCGGYHEGWCDDSACNNDPDNCCAGEGDGSDGDTECMSGLVKCAYHGRCQPSSEDCPSSGGGEVGENFYVDCAIENHSFKVKCGDSENGVKGDWAGCSQTDSCSSVNDCSSIYDICYDNYCAFNSKASCEEYDTGVGCATHGFTVACDEQWHTVGSWSPNPCTFYQEDLRVWHPETGALACGRAGGDCWDGNWSICQGKTVNPQYVCVDPMTASPSSPVPGQPVDLTCRGAIIDGTIDHFEFQNRINYGDWQDLGSILNNDGNNQGTITIDSAPEMPWDTRCRVCISQDSSQCTPWYEPASLDCISAGQTYNPSLPGYDGMTCCSGLDSLSSSDLDGAPLVCSDCGNGTCESWESNFNCSEDCGGTTITR